MALSANKAVGMQSKLYPPIEDGTYAARLVRVTDLGLQQNPFEPEKRANEILITFELMDEFLIGEDGKPDESKPRVISDFVKLYRGADKGKNVEYIKALDPDGNFRGDWGTMTAARLPCLVNIIQRKNGAGQVRNRLESISPPMKGMAFRDCRSEGWVFDLENPDHELYETFPDWIKEKIASRVRGDDLEPLSFDHPETKDVESEVPPEKVDEKVDEEDVPW